MQIQRILLISFFLLLTSVVTALTVVSFFASRSFLQEEIGNHLTKDAVMLMEEVDMLMFESVQDVHSWSKQDVIQEARIGDVDKRLAQFLTDTEAAYKGRYSELFYVDAQQKIIAASSPRQIGQLHPRAPNWLDVKVPNGDIVIEEPQLSPPYDNASLVIRATVQDEYSAETIGQFYGVFDLRQLFRLLDKASGARSDERYIALLDKSGRTIAASANLRQSQYLLKPVFAGWKPKQNETLFVHDGAPITASNVLVGYAKSKGYLDFAQLNWSLLIFENTAKAFLPVHLLWLMFGAAIVVTLILAFSASTWISGYIAKPLVGLTRWVRSVPYLENPEPPNVGGAREIGELERAFTDLLKELERSREHVTQTAKLAVVGEMAAIMAHEVRTPLGILSTSAQWLKREPDLSPEGREMAQFILDETDRLKKLVTTLLECARPREPLMREQNLHEIITHAVDLLAMQARKKSLKIDLVLQAIKPEIVCDNELLIQVFLNLIHNAIQFVPDNGLIRITTTGARNQLTVTIADNGPGIAETDYKSLFDPFFTRRPGGVGLGLTVTRQIVMAHHGKIYASASEWGGACFTIELPLNQD